MKNTISEIPSVCASNFDWSYGIGTASSSDLFEKSWFGGNKLLVKSPKTGVTKQFTLDLENAENNEYWDGEFTILFDEEQKIAIKIWNY